MKIHELAKTLIFVGATKPRAAMEQEMEARDVRVLWASSIKAAVDLLNSPLAGPMIITELALVDGNWRDLVEQVRYIGWPIPVVLLASVSTAELWWDALECGVEDILLAPLSASRLCQFLRTQSTIPDDQN